MADQLPGPAQPSVQDQWNTFLNQQPAVSSDLNSWRYGIYANRKTQNMYPTPVPHPQHKEYSSIEMARKKQAQARIQELKNRPRPQPKRQQHDMVFYPHTTEPNFNHVLRLRLPKGLM
jgi:hypothetical protein